MQPSCIILHYMKKSIQTEKNGREWCRYFSLPPTKTREALFDALSQSQAPKSVPEIQALFAKKKLFLNKTTVYREIENLVKRGILNKVQLSETRVSYEIAGDHHHHFVCQECDQVTELSFCEPTLKKVETLLAQQGKHVLHHNFEFFGICETCN